MDNANAALGGVRVIDLAQMFAGPGAAMHLADYGAEVIKIEPPWGDSCRAVHNLPVAGRESKPYLVYNRNKRSMVVDLRHREGQAIVHTLCRTADVVVCNYRPGVAERLGVDYDTLSAINPRLIYAQVTALGSAGPERHKRAYDLAIQARTGILAARRWPDGTPITSPVMVSDLAGAALLAYGIALALFERVRSGRGQKVEVSLLGAALAMQSYQLVRIAGDTTPMPGALSATYSPYRCADGEYLIIVIITQEEWQRLCVVLDVPHLATDPQYSDYAKRQARAETLQQLFAGIFATRTREEWLRLLEAQDIPCAPILPREEVFADPQVEANELLVRLTHPVVGAVDMVGLPVKLSRTPGRVEHPSPLLGADTGAILAELGYAPETISDLRARGIIC